MTVSVTETQLSSAPSVIHCWIRFLSAGLSVNNESDDRGNWASAAEYLTFVAASGTGGVEAVYADETCG